MSAPPDVALAYVGTIVPTHHPKGSQFPGTRSATACLIRAVIVAVLRCCAHRDRNLAIRDRCSSWPRPCPLPARKNPRRIARPSAGHHHSLENLSSRTRGVLTRASLSSLPPEAETSEAMVRGFAAVDNPETLGAERWRARGLVYCGIDPASGRDAGWFRRGCPAGCRQPADASLPREKTAPLALASVMSIPYLTST